MPNVKPAWLTLIVLFVIDNQIEVKLGDSTFTVLVTVTLLIGSEIVNSDWPVLTAFTLPVNELISITSGLDDEIILKSSAFNAVAGENLVIDKSTYSPAFAFPSFVALSEKDET